MTTKIGGFAIDICASCQMVAVTLGWHHDGGVSYCQRCVVHWRSWARMHTGRRWEILAAWDAVVNKPQVKAQIEAIASRQTEAA